MNLSAADRDSKIFFVRHGRTEWNRQGRLMGQTDIPLDRVGRRQARAVADWLRGRGVDRVYASPLVRARETGRAVAKALELPLRLDDRWREVNMGALAGLTWAEVQKRHPDFVRARSVDPANAVRLDGESDRAMQRRAIAAFRSAVADGDSGTAVVASHGGTIKAVLAYVLDMPLSEKWRLQVANGSVTLLHCSRRGWQIEWLNYTDHLTGAAASG